MLLTPLVTLLEQQGTDEPCDRRFVGEDPDIRPSFHLGVEPLQPIGRVDSGAPWGSS